MKVECKNLSERVASPEAIRVPMRDDMMQSARLSWKKAVTIGLVLYLAMGASMALGWDCYEWIHHHPVSSPASDGLVANILGYLGLVWTLLLVGPFVMSFWVAFFLFAPGSGGIRCLLFVLALAAAQYVLLFFAVRAVFRGRTSCERHLSGIFLVAYSFLHTYALIYFCSIM